MTTALVTGSSGYLGSHLVSSLQSSGCSVYRLSRSGSADLSLHEPDSQKHQDLTWTEFQALMTQEAPQLVFNCAADTRKTVSISDISLLVSSNCGFVAQLAEAVSATPDTRLIHATTFSGQLWKPDGPPQTLYAASKNCAENILQYYSQIRGLRSCIVEIFDVYGPVRKHEKLIEAATRALLEGSQFRTSYGTQHINPIYVTDVVRGLLCAADEILATQSPSLIQRSLRGPDILTVAQVLDGISEAVQLQWSSDQLDKTLVEQRLPVTDYSGRFPPPAGWQPQIGLIEGVRELVKAHYEGRQTPRGRGEGETTEPLVGS